MTRLPQLPRLFPFVFAVVTVTALAAANQGEGIRPENLIVPITLALLAAFVGWIMGRVLTSDRTTGGITALAFVLLVLATEYLFGWVDGLVQETPAAAIKLALCLLVFTLVAVCMRLFRVPQSLGRFFDIMAVSLLLFTVPGVVALWEDPASTGVPARSSALPAVVSETPDIYLVILDAYSGSRSLLRHYGFDNSPFQNSLRKRGFLIPMSSKANYVKTFLSVGSMLNREYADEVAEVAAPEYRDRRAAYHAMEVNQTAIDLRAMGYRFFYVGSSYPPMARNRLASDGRPAEASLAFERLWTSTTLYPATRRLWCRLRGCPGYGIPFWENAAETESYVERYLAYVGSDGPKFVYLHLLLPHGPFRFGPFCDPRPAKWTIGAGAVEDSVAERMFIEQLRCTNEKLLEIVDAIQSSGREAVILLQADHGHGGFPGGIPASLNQSTERQVSERFDVFAAYHAPGRLGDSLAAVRSPVNLFRTLFRVQWGMPEPPLPDRTFWSNPDRPLDLIEVDASPDD